MGEALEEYAKYFSVLERKYIKYTRIAHVRKNPAGNARF